MLDRLLKRSLCVLLALLLIITGLGLGQSHDVPVLARDQGITGIAAILPVSHAPYRDLYLQEEQQSAVQPVQRARTTSKLQTLRSGDHIAFAAGEPLAAVSFGPAWYSPDWEVFTPPSWQAIVSLIHRTRRKSC